MDWVDDMKLGTEEGEGRLGILFAGLLGERLVRVVVWGFDALMGTAKDLIIL